jgi:YVTN family beta-propeller protein
VWQGEKEEHQDCEEQLSRIFGKPSHFKYFGRSQVALEKSLIGCVVMLGACTVIAAPAAAQTRSPLLLAINKDQNALTIIDPLSRETVGVVPVGEHPHNVAVSTDGKLAFVTNQDGGSISVIDIAARKELRRVDLGPGSRPHGIYYAAARVYFTADAYKLIGCYDPASNKIEWLQGTGQDAEDGMLAVTKDGDKIFATYNRSDTVTALERTPAPSAFKEHSPWLEPRWTLTNINAGREPMGIDISPDGKEVWTADESEDRVSIIDVATLKLIRTFTTGSTRTNRLVFTPDGKLVLLASSRPYQGVLVLEVQTRNPGVVKRLGFDGDIPSGIVVTPDGSRAYVSLHDKGIGIIDLTTLEVQKERISIGKTPPTEPPKKTIFNVPTNPVEWGQPFPEGLGWSETR